MPSNKLLNSVKTDRDLLQRVNDFTSQVGCAKDRTLEIRVERGVAVVQGWAPRSFLRPMVVECTRSITGFLQIVDLSEVADDSRQLQPNNYSKIEQESSVVFMGTACMCQT